MAGINIPSTALAKRGEPKGKLARVFDRGLAFSLVLIVVVFGTWGVLWLLRFQIDREIKGYHDIVDNSFSSVDVESTIAIEDFSDRINIASETLESRVRPIDTLALLERETLPEVTLTSFEQNAENGTITIIGLTGDYRYLAEQILRYRQQELLQNIGVSSSERTESGQVKFELAVIQPVPEKEVVTETE